MSRDIDAAAAAQLLDLLRGQRSARSFTPDLVPVEVERALLDAARCAPSAEDSQPWYFVVVRTQEAKERLNWVARDSERLYSTWYAAAPGLPDFTTVPLCIAVFADGREAQPYVEGELPHVTAAAMAAQNIWLAAQALGLGAFMWEHLEQDQIKAVLGVPHHQHFVGLLCIGYAEGPAREPAPRRHLEEVTGWEWFRVKEGSETPPDKRKLLDEFLDF